MRPPFENPVWVGDCREVMAGWRAETVPLAVTDPPYNQGIDYGNGYDDRQDPRAYLAMLRGAFAEVHRLLTPTGSLFVFIGVKYQAETLVMLKRIGFTLRNTIVWHHTFGQAQRRKFTPSWTAIHYVVKDPNNFTFNADAVRVPSARQLLYGDRRANPRGKLPDDTWVLVPAAQAPQAFRPHADVWKGSRVCGTFK